MKVTNQMIEAGKSERGGWSRKQLQALGETWPPVPGWKKRAIGREISPAVAMELFRFKQRVEPA